MIASLAPWVNTPTETCDMGSTLCFDRCMAQEAALLTTSDAAERLGVSVSTVRRWARDGRVRHVLTPTGRVLFRAEDVEAAYRVVEPERRTA